MEAIYLVLGVLVLALVYWDLFESIVVPRPTPGWFRIARYVVRGSWRVVRAIGRGRDGRRHETLLGLYAPAATAALLAVWLSAAILGFGLILFALRDQLQPVPPDLGSAVYAAATTVLTLGGDVAATGTAARLVVVLAAATGLGVVALVVTFLFSLYASYQRREIQVVTLQAAAGAPPSAVALLETYSRLGLTDRLPGFFNEWERWAAEVLDSHVAYPLLGFFRSSHDNLSWISALGSVLDAASLVLTTIEGVPRGEAELFRRAGSHLAEDISNLGYRMGSAGRADRSDANLDRGAFDAAWARLKEAGYELAPADRAWPAFEAARAEYAARLEGLAAYWATPSTSWLGTNEALRSPAHPDDQAVTEAR
ncbi:MAG: potassium channel family protein [Candidatus Limnocylindrales bacterium]